MNTHHPMFYFSISYTTFHLQIPSFPTMTRDLLPWYSEESLYSKEDSIVKVGFGFFFSITPCSDTRRLFEGHF